MRKNKHKKTYHSVFKNPSYISKQYSTLFTPNSWDAHDKVPNGGGMTTPLFLGPLIFEGPSLWYMVWKCTSVVKKRINKKRKPGITSYHQHNTWEKKNIRELTIWFSKTGSWISKQYSTLFTLNSRDAHDRVQMLGGMARPLFLGPLRFVGAFPPTTWTAESLCTSFNV